MRHPILWRRGLAFLALSLVFVLPGSAQDMLSQFEQKMTEFTLDNGLKFLIVERHEAPVISFYTYADVGSVDEVKGITGLAHMFEHMAFKGTVTIGSKDIEKEMEAMTRVDEVYTELKREQHKGSQANPDVLAQLEADFKAAQEEAREYVENGEFEKVIERAGGTGLNASTNFDATDYYYSLPANKLELWFSLESDRFLNPVLREFYTERDVVMEERRMRTESNPFGRLVEEFFSIAFKAHPYGEPIIGHMSDLQSFTRAEATAFFKKYYGANNLTIAIVGDMDPDQAKALAETYFGRLPKLPKPDPVETVEPLQIGERRIIVEEPTQPLVLMGWHKDGANNPDDAVYDVLADILSNGRTSRIYKRLIEEEKIALQAAALNSFPGYTKYPNMFLAFAATNQGHEPEEAEEAIYDILEQIKQEGVTADELERAKTRARADLIRQLQSNSGIGIQVAYYEVITGDWRNLFQRLDGIAAVTSEDVQRIVAETFTKKNRTVAMIKTTAESTAAADEADEAKTNESGR